MGADKIKAKKYLGQHFLKDTRIAASIVEALRAEECDAVIEVGAGTGAITGFLADRHFPSFRVVEIDDEAVSYLRKNMAHGIDEIINGDFLDLDLGSYGDRIAIIGNFPYNISSQIFFKILENRDRVDEVVCMVQKEVAQRICSAPGNRVYGILSVLLSAWYDIDYLFTVNETVFSPQPKVKSAVIRLQRNGRTRLDCDEKLFIEVVKTCFGQRRKMLRNPLRAMIGSDITGMPYLSMRAEQLSVEQYEELTEWVARNRQNMKKTREKSE